VDDEAAMRETIGDMLKSLGYTVVTFENGRDAVDFFNKEFSARRTIAGLIVDLTIPGGMGGKEAVVEIRKVSRETPVFVASGYAEDPVIAQPEKYGFTGSICKPLRKSELVKMLNRGLGKKQ
jgi:two-component system cell cycle sensor histidine kinase/response regulator CckA